ncbi:MAG: DMT family transporter [Desulfobacteraceae bacterium]|nr:DMT family transporter [Desulfobacteraceae bacterium]
MKNAHRGCLLKVHSAVMLFGAAGLFAKLVDLPSPVIVLGRVFFAAVSLGVLLAVRRQSIRLDRKRDYGYLLLLGWLLALHWASFFQAIRMSSVAVGLLTFSTFPVFATFLEPFFFREPIRVRDILIAAVVVFGVFLVVPDVNLNHSITRGALWGVLSGFTFALLSVLNRKTVRRYPSLVIAFYQDAAAALVLIPFLFELQPAIGGREWLLLALLGVVFTALSHSLFIDGLSGVRAQTASIIACLEPVYGIALAALLLGERPEARVLAGGIVILAATFYATATSDPGVERRIRPPDVQS